MDTNKIRKNGDECVRLSQILKVPFVMPTMSKTNGNERFKEVYESKARRRKLRSGIIAALLMVLILLTGTYAWIQFNNIGFNAVYTETNFGGRFHNNFQWANESGQGTHNKNLFAENFGNNQIFVRVRLREFFRAGEGAEPIGHTTEHPVLLNNPSTWPVYQAQDNDVRTRRLETDSAAIGNRGISWTLGHTGGPMYFMPTFNRANGEISNSPLTNLTVPWNTIITVANHTFADQMVETSGGAVDALAGEFEIGAVTDISGIRELGSQTSPLRADNEPSDGSRNFWAPEGVPAESALTPILEVDEITGNLIQGTPTVHTARQTNMPMTTLEGEPMTQIPEWTENGIMTFAQWYDEDMPIGNFWVMDAQGGWFYYAIPLPGGQATSMLLSEIIVDDINDEGIEYIVEVEAEFAIRSRVAIDMFYNEPVPEEVRLLWGEIEYEVTFEQTEPMEMARGTTVTLASPGSVSMRRISILGEIVTLQISSPTVTWSIEGREPGSEGPAEITVNEATGEVTVENTVLPGEGVAYVVATATAPSGMVARARRQINIPYHIPELANATIGATWTDTTEVDWCVLVEASSTIGGIGNALIITRYIVGTSAYNANENVWVPFMESTLRTSMDAWYSNSTNVSSLLGVITLNVTGLEIIIPKWIQ